MSDKPVSHGIEHRPGSYDPSCTDPWTYVLPSTTLPIYAGGTYHAGSSPSSQGDLVVNGVYQYECIQTNTGVAPGSGNWGQYWRITAPIFQNGWANQGGSLEHMSYRLNVGAQHVLDRNNPFTILDYTDHQVELQGSVGGGLISTVVFWLPPGYWPLRDKRLPASDDVGGFVPFTVKANGAVYKGLA